jgi:hypothetical protein
LNSFAGSHLITLIQTALKQPARSSFVRRGDVYGLICEPFRR